MPPTNDLQEFVNWCEENEIYPVGDRDWDWAELLNIWEDARRGPQPPGSVTPIDRRR